MFFHPELRAYLYSTSIINRMSHLVALEKGYSISVFAFPMPTNCSYRAVDFQSTRRHVMGWKPLYRVNVKLKELKK